MDLAEYGFAGVDLMDDESVDTALDLVGDRAKSNSASHRRVVLTDRRVIHLDGKNGRERAVVASLRDVDAVELTEEDEGSSAYVWAGLAFVAALFLYFVIDNIAGRISGTAAVVFLGVYLIADRLISSGRPVLVFQTGPAQLRCGIKNGRPVDDLYPFINRLFELKSAAKWNGASRVGRFAPR